MPTVHTVTECLPYPCHSLRFCNDLFFWFYRHFHGNRIKVHGGFRDWLSDGEVGVIEDVRMFLHPGGNHSHLCVGGGWVTVLLKDSIALDLIWHKLTVYIISRTKTCSPFVSSSLSLVAAVSLRSSEQHLSFSSQPPRLPAASYAAPSSDEGWAVSRPSPAAWASQGSCNVWGGGYHY